MTRARRLTRDESRLQAWRAAPMPATVQEPPSDEERRLQYVAHEHRRLPGEGAGTYALRLRRLAGLDVREPVPGDREPGEDDDE